jgi:hypothetical protein
MISCPDDIVSRMTAQRRIPSKSPLHDAPEEGIGVTVPAPLSDRINALVDLLHAAGERTSRKELIAALILTARPLSKELAEMLRAYRRASVRDALVDPDRAGETIKWVPRKPGPRPRRRG